MSRDVFLDNEVNDKSIERQFNRLIMLAKAKGYAVAIGHPHRETIRMLRKLLPRLKALGVELVPISSQVS